MKYGFEKSGEFDAKRFLQFSNVHLPPPDQCPLCDMLSIDGVMPSKESLRVDKYPFVSSIYAGIRKTEDHESMAYKLYQFLFTKKGADMIDESGYIAIRK